MQASKHTIIFSDGKTLYPSEKYIADEDPKLVQFKVSSRLLGLRRVNERIDVLSLCLLRMDLFFPQNVLGVIRDYLWAHHCKTVLEPLQTRAWQQTQLQCYSHVYGDSDSFFGDRLAFGDRPNYASYPRVLSDLKRRTADARGAELHRQLEAFYNY
jgi:hypothetical protein